LTKRLFILLFLFLTQIVVAQSDNYLRDTSLSGNKLKLTFKYKIDNVKSLALESNGIIKYIYDIKNGVLPKSKKISHYKHRGIKAFRMGQLNKRYLRIVIESYSKNRKNYSIDGRVLTIYLNASKLSSGYISKRILKKSSKKKYYKKAKKSQKIIIIDAGHGGKDRGAASENGRIKEKVITLQIAKKLKSKLQKKGYKVYMTRTSDRYLSLKERTEFANAHRGNMFISIHANAAPVGKRKANYQGIELFYLSLKNSKRLKKKRAFYKGEYIYSKHAYNSMTSSYKITKSRQLSKHIKREILRSVRRRNRVVDKGIKKNDFWVLLASQMPAVLIETGYLTHKREARNLTSGRYQNLIVQGIVKGVDAYYR
jgi:N-acetylmuramoyl-L-alanine amidase